MDLNSLATMQRPFAAFDASEFPSGSLYAKESVTSARPGSERRLDLGICGTVDTFPMHSASAATTSAPIVGSQLPKQTWRTASNHQGGDGP